MTQDAEQLRSPDNIYNPDPRTQYFVVIDGVNELPRPLTITDQHRNISKFVLSHKVPADIVIHFETAKNLYLYAWHVFRFYPVAQQHAFASLEYALRIRLTEYVKKFNQEKRGRDPTLSSLLKEAIALKLLNNNLFPNKYEWATKIARDRFRSEIHKKMISERQSEVVYDDAHIRPTEEDLNHDWLSNFIDSIPVLRNDLAHGSSTLHHSVTHSFDVVSSMINQLYKDCTE